MNFKPILFKTPMVEALLEDRKTQTRRAIFPQPQLINDNVHFNYGEQYYLTREQLIENAKYKVGDILWVRETWCPTGTEEYLHTDTGKPFFYKADCRNLDAAEETMKEFGYKWKPSIFMPKEACRLFLEVINVRLERVQDISEEDILSEGIFIDENDLPALRSKWTPELVMSRALKKEWKSLWQTINGQASWKYNMWVWVYDIKKIEKPSEFLKQAS